MKANRLPQPMTKNNLLWGPGVYGLIGHAPKAVLLRKAEAALDAGLAVLQSREKIADTTEKEDVARALFALCQRYQRPFVINDTVELVAKVGADAIHLGQTDTPILQAKAKLPAQTHIGITCHDSITLAHEAAQAGADLIAFGAFFDSTTKKNSSTCSFEILKQACQDITVPIAVIGGITEQNVSLFSGFPISYIAVSAAIFSGETVYENTAKLVQLFHTLRVSRYEGITPRLLPWKCFD